MTLPSKLKLDANNFAVDSAFDIFLVVYLHIMGSITNVIWLFYFHSAIKVWSVCLAPTEAPYVTKGSVVC